MTEALTEHAVPHLVVILGKDHKLLRWDVTRGIAVSPPAISRVFAGIHKPLAKCLGQLLEVTEILVVPAPIVGEQDVQSMVKIVIPLGIERIAPQFAWSDDAGIVQRTLGDGINPPIQALGTSVQRQAEFFEKRLGGVVDNGMDGIEPQCVDVELGDPEEGIVDEKAPDFIAVRPIKIEGRRPMGCCSAR